jgi:hypothetical protein
MRIGSSGELSSVYVMTSYDFLLVTLLVIHHITPSEIAPSASSLVTLSQPVTLGNCRFSEIADYTLEYISAKGVISFVMCYRPCKGPISFPRPIIRLWKVRLISIMYPTNN